MEHRQELTRRLVYACHGCARPLVYREAWQVVGWALESLDWRVIDEEIGWAALSKPGLILPRGLVPAIRERATRHGVRVAQWDG